MSEEVKFQDVEVEVETECCAEPCAAEQTKKGAAVETVTKTINNLVESLESALKGRENTVMVRVNNDVLAKLDMLVAAGICKSRSESAAFLLQRGIEGSDKLFARISDITSQITKLRDDLLASVQE